MVSFGIAQHSGQQQQKSMRQRSDSGIGIGIDSDSSVQSFTAPGKKPADDLRRLVRHPLRMLPFAVSRNARVPLRC